jgi:hypothetical protein
LAAIKAVKVAVDGIIVSNHGAHQLDYTPATISILEEVTLYFSIAIYVVFPSLSKCLYLKTMEQIKKKGFLVASHPQLNPFLEMVSS